MGWFSRGRLQPGQRTLQGLAPRGQGPSDHPDLARWLMEQGIDSVSLNPDTVVETWLYLGKSAG